MPGRADGTAPSSRCLSTRGYTALYRYTQSWACGCKHSMNLKRAHNSSKSTKSCGSRSRPNLLPCSSPSHPFMATGITAWNVILSFQAAESSCPLCIAWNSYGFFPTKSSKSPCETQTPLKPIDRSRTLEGVIPPFRRQMQCQSPLLRT